MYHPKYGSRYTTPYFTDEENQKLEADLQLMHRYTGNHKLKIGDLLKTKVLADNLLSPDELEIERRKLLLLEEISKSVSKILEISSKTTANINLIARDVSLGRLENPESFVLKDSQWEVLLGAMRQFKNEFLSLMDYLKGEVGKLKILKANRI